MKYLGFLINLLNGSFSVVSFVKKILIKKTLIGENKKIHDMNKTGAQFLIWWAAGNILVGALMLFLAFGKLLSFFEMNIIWSILILIGGFLSFRTAKNNSTVEHETISDFWEMISGIEKTFIFNGGINTSLMIVGFYLIDKGIATTSTMLTGFGASIFMQSVVLIIYNVVMYLLNHSSAKKVINSLKEIDSQK